MATLLRTTWYRCPRGGPGTVPIALPRQAGARLPLGAPWSHGGTECGRVGLGPKRIDAGAAPDDTVVTAAEGDLDARRALRR